MIVVMKPTATDEEIRAVAQEIEANDLRPSISRGSHSTVIGCIGEINGGKAQLCSHFRAMPGVEFAQVVSKPFKLASREFHPDNTIITLNGHPIGGRRLFIIAGPCAVESEPQLMQTAQAVKAAGAHGLRGGVFKPRTSPYSFQGLGIKGLPFLGAARQATGLPVVTEVMAIEQIEPINGFAEVLQVGARNMQNFDLLRALGQNSHPVLLKRGPAATINDLLLAAEYLLVEGNHQVILCERGVVSATLREERHRRNLADISAIALLKLLTHLPVFFDPSHSTGDSSLVIPTSLAAIAAGADGLIVEVHHDPKNAQCDGSQSLTFAQFQELMVRLKPVADAVDRSI